MKINGMDDRWLSTKEVAQMLGISKMTVYRLVERDELYSIRIGHLIKISEASVGRFVAQGGTTEKLFERKLRAV